MVRTLDGAKIVLILTNNMTDMTNIYLLCKNSRVPDSLKQYAVIQKEQGYYIQRFCINDGREFNSHKVNIFMDTEYIQ